MVHSQPNFILEGKINVVGPGSISHIVLIGKTVKWYYIFTKVTNVGSNPTM